MYGFCCYIPQPAILGLLFKCRHHLISVFVLICWQHCLPLFFLSWDICYTDKKRKHWNTRHDHLFS
jgi:hypothetical protein